MCSSSKNHLIGEIGSRALSWLGHINAKHGDKPVGLLTPEPGEPDPGGACSNSSLASRGLLTALPDSSSLYRLCEPASQPISTLEAF